MDYQEAIGFMKNLTKFGINLGLGRIQELLRRLGNPEKELKFVHIAGTNGKGSTAAMIASIFQADGQKTGFFSSPHIHSYNERFRIDQKNITDDDLAKIIFHLKSFLQEMVGEGFEQPTEFEVSTAVALLYFKQKKVDWVVWETGLGGEIDSTNVVLPQVSVITTVAFDHMDYLGDSLQKIALVKAGIIKPNTPVVTGVENSEALTVIKKKAAALKAPLWVAGEDFHGSYNKKEDKLQYMDFGGKKNFPKIENLALNLFGRHQIKNAALAVVVADLLQVKEKSIRKGLLNVVWPCRLEKLGEDPLILIDAAHNEEAVLSLAAYLQEFWPQRSKNLLIGMLADKERQKVADILAPLFAEIMVTKPNNPRAKDWKSFVGFWPREKEVMVEEDISLAIEKIKKKTDPKGMIVITGSIYMVSEAREYLLRSKGENKK